LAERAAKAPVEKARVYVLLAFLHAVVQERLRYAPNLGWKGFWEFNDSDVSRFLRLFFTVTCCLLHSLYSCSLHLCLLLTSSPQYECSAFVIDSWVESVAQGRSNVAPQKLPWDMIRTLVTETYGGKVDDAGDFRQLEQLVDQVLTPAAFDDDHSLVSGGEHGERLALPGTTGIGEFTAWVNGLPEREPPTYLGLPANAEKLLLVGQGTAMMADVARVTTLLDEGEQLMMEAA
jgi:dynein heavy chain 1, cytosolic